MPTYITASTAFFVFCLLHDLCVSGVALTCNDSAAILATALSVNTDHRVCWISSGTLFCKAFRTELKTIKTAALTEPWNVDFTWKLDEH